MKTQITRGILKELVASKSFRSLILYFDEVDYSSHKCCMGWPTKVERVDRAMWAIPDGETDLRTFYAYQCANSYIPLYDLGSNIKICKQHLEMLPSWVFPLKYWEDVISKAHQEKENWNWHHLGGEISRGIFEEVRNSDPNEEIYQSIKIEDVQGLLEDVDRDCY